MIEYKRSQDWVVEYEIAFQHTDQVLYKGNLIFLSNAIWIWKVSNLHLELRLNPGPAYDKRIEPKIFHFYKNMLQ